MTPTDLLDHAHRLLTEPPRSMATCWQRSCAALTRTALEHQLAAYWLAVSPTLAGSSYRHQLLALPTFAGRDAATAARACWYGLSRAVHHHTYELPPTLAELRGWHADVTALLPALGNPTSVP